MKDDKAVIQTTSLQRVTANLLPSSWDAILAITWKLARKLFQGMTEDGMYDVLEYESVLELMDKGGKQAVFRKRKKVRYLQNNIIAYQDYGWGDGQQFLDYRAKPGVPVDCYRIGYKTYILISLREVKNRGDVDEFSIQWKIKNGFLKPDGFWETEISSPTKHLKISVIFPQDRPPQGVRLVENNHARTQALGTKSIRQLPDGKWQVTWEKSNPQLFEHYILRWDW